MRIARSFVAIAFVLSSPLFAAMQSKRQFNQQWSLAPGGAIEVNNAFGNVEIVGTDDPDVAAIVTKTIVGTDEKALEEGHDRTELRVGGDDRLRIINTINPLGRNPRWSASVDYVLRIPHAVHVRVKASTSARIRVANVRGNVTVTTFSGLVILDNVSGAATVENTNGSILMISDRPTANADLTSINGDVTVVVPPTANFQWVAESLKGDIRSTIPVRGDLMGTSFRGNVNAPGGPQIRTRTMVGATVLVHRGAQPGEAVALQAVPQSSVRMVSDSPSRSSAPPRELVRGPRFEWKGAIGDLNVPEIRGDAFIETGAGEVRLGTVFGTASVRSGGGPLHLGEVHGTILAFTRAGDVTVDAARMGGNIQTAGGMVRVLYTGGPTALSSGGGDIVVHQAVSSINASTRSGDINVTMDWSARSENVVAKTATGNITLNVNPRFAATIDATVVTSDAEAHTIKSEIAGLAIQREQIAGGKTRIRATGRINGGGERVELSADEGGIRILTQQPAPLPKR